MERTVYSDFDVQFGMHPITKDLIKKTNEQSVRQSLRLLIQTSFYDRKWQPDVGCNLNELIFGQLDQFQLFSTEETLKKVITKYEPRIELKQLSCTVNDSYVVTVKIVYRVIMLDKTDTFIYNINKLR